MELVEKAEWWHKMSKTKPVVIFSLAVLNLFLFGATFAFSTDGMLEPVGGYLALFYVRFILFSLVTILGPIFIIRYMDQENGSTGKTLKWVLLIFALMVLGVLLSDHFVNYLQFDKCCGDSSSLLWGYPFSYLKDNGYPERKFGEVNWIALIANINFCLNTAFIITEIGKYFRARASKIR